MTFPVFYDILIPMTLPDKSTSSSSVGIGMPHIKDVSWQEIKHILYTTGQDDYTVALSETMAIRIKPDIANVNSFHDRLIAGMHMRYDSKDYDEKKFPIQIARAAKNLILSLERDNIRTYDIGITSEEKVTMTAYITMRKDPNV